MKLARFWTRAQGEAIGRDGDTVRTVARGWSNDSMDAARACARELADRVAARLASGMPERRQYEYGERPLPEPVIQAFTGQAVVTRNAYGALVLNAERLMFVDVDRKAAAEGRKRGGLLASLFGKSVFGKPAEPPSSAPDPVVESLRPVAERRGLAARVYETAAGYRLAILNVGYDAESAEAEAVLTEFGSDPLYIRLCRQQGSFRARLTPKPWRVKYYQLPVKFPFEPAGELSRYQRWEEGYNARCGSFATCRYVTAFGPAIVAPEFDELIRFHDRETKAASGLPLA